MPARTNAFQEVVALLTAVMREDESMMVTPSAMITDVITVHYLPTRLQEWGMRFVFRADLIHERAYAWECAEALVAAGGAGQNPYAEPEMGGSSAM